MASCDQSDLGLFVQGIQGMIQLHSRETEDNSYAFLIKGFHESLAAGHLDHNFLR